MKTDRWAPIRAWLLALTLTLGLFWAPAWAVQPPYRIGVLYWSMSIPGQVAMRQGLEVEATRINKDARRTGARPVELIVRVAGDGPEGIRRQIAQMTELVQMRPDVLIVQPTDNAALAEPLRLANRLGVPVVAYDQYIRGGRLAAYVTSDNRQAGYLGGEYLAAHFPNNRPLRLVLVEYPHVSSTVERLDGFLDALQEHGQPYQILKTYKAVQPEEGAAAGRAILKDFPARGSIDAIFTVNDGGGLSLARELDRGGRHEIVLASVDGDPEAVKLLAAGRLYSVDSAQFCGPLGAEALKTAYAVAQGKAVPGQILVPVFPVTRETLNRYPGWLGPIPAAFTKPWKAREPDWAGHLKVLP
jgi:ribose transport system substrate-binding protein